MVSGMAGMSDIHSCVTPSPVPPHGPGVVVDGSKTVLINNMPACCLGDKIIETLGPHNKIVKGETTENNLGFAPHGAGRNISRSKHIRKKDGKSAHEIFAEETKDIDARFFSKHIDISELPSAYKNAQSVQEQMREFGLGEIVDEIIPYGCIMAGNWKVDAPWKRKKLKR